LGSPSNPVVIALVEFEGHRLLDIRKHFFEKASSRLKPTKKGISLTAGVAKQVQETINSNAETIFAWLEGRDTSAVAQVEKAMQLRAKAAEQETLRPRCCRVEERRWQGPEFFACEANGAEDLICLNTRHSFLDMGKQGKASSGQHLVLLLAAYYRAKLRFSGEIEAHSDHFFKLLEAEWGAILANYCGNPEVIVDD